MGGLLRERERVKFEFVDAEKASYGPNPATYILGNVQPPSSKLTINGKPVALHPKGGFLAFVPMSPGSAEDDGWLITSVIDLPTDSSEVLIYHAQDLLGGPVATIHVPHRPNAGFHGNWIPDSEIEGATGRL